MFSTSACTRNIYFPFPVQQQPLLPFLDILLTMARYKFPLKIYYKLIKILFQVMQRGLFLLTLNTCIYFWLVFGEKRGILQNVQLEELY